MSSSTYNIATVRPYNSGFSGKIRGIHNKYNISTTNKTIKFFDIYYLTLNKNK